MKRYFIHLRYELKNWDLGILEIALTQLGSVPPQILTDHCFSSLGNLTLNAYNEDCEFADPAGSFRGLRRFKRNCSNFGSLLEKSNMKLMKWEEYEVIYIYLFIYIV